MSKDITCKLPDERAAFWKTVLGTDTVCIVSPMPVMAELPEIGLQPVYMLDLETLDTDQKTRLTEALSTRFSVPLDETVELIAKQGVPIWAEGCIVMVIGQALGLLIDDAADEHWDDDEDDCSYEDDAEDWRYDPNRCPMCGDWLDAEGNCSDMECGWLASDDDDYDDESEVAQVPPDDFGDIPF